MHPVIELSLELMERPSVTPDDCGCQQLIRERLEPLGFQATDYSHEGITNTWYTHGSGEPVLIFAGHTDVVPAGDENAWSNPPFEPKIIDDFLHGRGACDMKGAVAAMVIALEQFVTENPDHAGTLALALTSDEEGPAVNGMRHLIDQLPSFKNAAVLTGEPTCPNHLGEMTKPGRRGSMHGTVTVLGEQMHVAYPQENKNAIHQSAAIIDALDNLRWPAANGFPDTSVQCYAIHADAGASNVIPAQVTLKWNCRYGVSPGADAVINDITKALEKSGIPHELSIKISSQPFMTQAGPLSKMLDAAIETHTNQKPIASTSGGTSDSRFWAAKGFPVIDFGPVNKTIHQVNECVAVKDLKTLSDIYLTLIQHWTKG